MNNKGISEIISQILLLLITVIVIGIVIGALVPQITRSQSRLNFEESKRVRDNIYSNIQEVYNSPIGYTKEINLALENLTLVIDADTNSIEVYSLIDGDFYKDGLRQDETSEKYTYRRGQKVYAGFTLSNINLVRSYVLENVTRTSIYLRKTDKEKITVLLENVTEDSWFTSSNLGLYTENPSTWQYRKKILLDGNKVDGNLTNFPVLIYLEDEDLRDYANADGNDIIFTLGDGKTKLKREIESYGVRNEYEYRKKITIDSDKVEEDLTDFPMLVSLVDSDLKTYAQSDGSDIYFTTSDGETRLKREIESFEDKNLLRKKITIDKDKVDGNLTDFPVLISLEDENLATYSKVDGSDIYFTASDGETRLKREIESFEDVNTYRKKITIDSNKVDEDLTDFPVLISLTDSNLATFAKADGSDIYFTLPDGTRLKREIESFEDVNTYRKKITIDSNKVDEDLTDFPVLISLTDSNLASFAKEDGSDIYFTASDGETRLKREIEDYNSTTGAIVAWVKVPELSSTTDTNIYMHFGDEDENNSNDLDVWDNNFVNVLHLNGNNTTNLSDSTSNGYAGIKKAIGDPINLFPGKIGGGQDLQSSGSYIIGRDLSTKISTTYTFETWINTNTIDIGSEEISTFGRTIAASSTTLEKPLWVSLRGSEIWVRTFTNNDPIISTTGANITTNHWHHLAITATRSGTTELYIDGNKYGEAPSGTLYSWNTVYTIGDLRPDRLLHFDGKIDEVRLSNSIRSESWIKTEYNNQSSPEDFYTTGELETTTTKELIAWVKIPALSSTEDTNIYMHFGNIDENNTNDTDVWDSNFISVWHKNDFNSTTILDSTTNNITGTKSASPPLQTIGKIGKAQIYNNQHISIGQNKLAPLLNGTTGITVTAWIKPNTLNTEGWILFEYITSTNVIFTMRTHSDKTFSTSGRSGISDGSQQHYSTATLNENEWQYIVIQADYTNTKQNTYYNGIYDNNSTPIWGNTTLVTGTPSSDARIGNHQTAGRNFDGIIDELRVSKIVRSPSWIKTEYNNQSSPETFYSIGELETTTKKELIAWVKIPELSSTTNTDIYMYFGDASENNPNDTDVWDSNYLFVQHFNDNVLDSTINNRNGTINGTPTYVDGIVGKGLQFNGNPDSVIIDYSEDLSGAGNFSVSAWTKYTGSQTYIIVQSHALPPNTYASDWFFPYLSNIFWMRSGIVGSATAINNDNWHQITMVWDKSLEKYKGYVDGQFIAESNTISGYGGTGTIKIGGRGDLTTTFFIGTIDNIRVSNSIKSSEWIKTEYNNQSSPESFYSVGCVEEVSFDKELIAWVKIPELSSTTDTNIYVYFGNEDENNTNDTDVWDEDFVLVQQLNNEFTDLTVYQNNCINTSATPTTDRFEDINSAMQFPFPDPGNARIDCGNDSSLLVNNITISTWIYPFSYDVHFPIFVRKGDNYRTGLRGVDDGRVYFRTILDDGEPSRNLVSTVYVPINEWTLVTGTYDGDKMRIYLNGEINNTSPSYPGNILGSEDNLIIGAYSTTGAYAFDGKMDAVKISKTARSAEWIKTEYNNQSTPEDFYTTGELETITTPHTELFAWVKIPELTTGINTPIYMYFGNPSANEINDKDIWDDDYVLVNHLNEDLLDSTYRNNSFINYNATNVLGKINTAFYFDGAYTTKMNTETSEYFNLNNSDFTMSGWFYIPSSATQVSWGGIMVGGSYTSGIDLACGRVLSGTGAPLSISFTSSVPRDIWYYLTLTHNVSEKKGTVYFNGDYKAEDTYPDTLPTTNKTINLAQDQIYMTGSIDEVRISKIARASDWIKTEYTNQANPEEFIKTGILEKA